MPSNFHRYDANTLLRLAETAQRQSQSQAAFAEKCRRRAQAIEAAEAGETGTGSTEGESAVLAEDAPKPSPLSPKGIQ